VLAVQFLEFYGYVDLRFPRVIRIIKFYPSTAENVVPLTGNW
jgi:hypothetical protein